MKAGSKLLAGILRRGARVSTVVDSVSSVVSGARTLSPASTTSRSFRRVTWIRDLSATSGIPKRAAAARWVSVPWSVRRTV